MQINFDVAKPIYLQIIDEFKKSLARGELKPGDKLPSQRELAKKIKVNPNTVQKSYQEMERMGLVETLRGQGTFIKEDAHLLRNIREEMAREALESFLVELYSLGYEKRDILQLVEGELEDKGGDGSGK